jgi:hypothetical protein
LDTRRFRAALGRAARAVVRRHSSLERVRLTLTR